MLITITTKKIKNLIYVTNINMFVFLKAKLISILLIIQAFFIIIIYLKHNYYEIY